VNQCMTRNALKEYVAEIERLKADVLAAREKNGNFFSEEMWHRMSAEQELKETEVAEARKQVEIIENQLRSVRQGLRREYCIADEARWGDEGNEGAAERD
jgi:kinesin family member 11